MSWERFLKQVSIQIEKSISDMFDFAHEITKRIVPSAEQVNNFTKKHFGFKVFAYAPSDYDSPKELAKQAKQLINLGYSQYAIDFVDKLKEKQDKTALQDVANYISKQIDFALRKQDYGRVVYLSTLAERIDPNFKENFKNYIMQQTNGHLKYEAIEKARRTINYIENATLILNTAALGLGVGSVFARPFLTPAFRLLTDALTGFTIASTLYGEARIAQMQGRNPLTAIFDPFNLAIAVDVAKSVKEAPKLTKEASAKLILNKPTEQFITDTLANLTHLTTTKLQIKQDLETVKSTLALVNKNIQEGLSFSENIIQALYKHAGTKSASALYRLATAYLHDTQIASEINTVAKYIYNKPEVKQALSRYIREDGSIKVNAGEVERILFELSKKDHEIYNFLALQRITSLNHAISKALEDRASVIHVKRLDEDVIIHTFDVKSSKVDDIIKPIFKELDEGNTLVLMWKNVEKDKSDYLILKPAYHPSYDHFITLRGLPMVVATSKGKPFDELLPELKQVFTDEEIENLRKIVGNRLITILDNEYINIPYHNIANSRDYINAILKSKLDDAEAQLIHGKFTVYYNNNIFPHKLKSTAKALENIVSMLKNSLDIEIKEVSDIEKLLKNDEIIEKFLASLKLSEEAEAKLTNIARFLDEIAFKQAPELHREGKGFAILFKDYDSFVDYASSKMWSRVYADMTGIKAFHILRDHIESVSEPNRTDLQKLILDFVRAYEGKTGNELLDMIKSFNLYLGSAYTMFNTPITVANYGQYLALASTLFPSLKLFSGAMFKHFMEEVKTAYKQAGLRHGLYKYHALNPLVPIVEGLIRASIRATIEDEVGFKNVIDDLAKFLAKFNPDDAKAIADDLYNFYKNNKELLIDDLERIIVGGDPRTLGITFLKDMHTREAFISWYKFIFSPLALGLQASQKFLSDIGRGDLKALAKGMALSSILALSVGTQAVPYFAPFELSYTMTKHVANAIGYLLGIDVPEILDEKSLGYAIHSRVADIIGIEVLNPKSKYYIFEASGREIVKYLAGEDLINSSVGWNILARGLEILKMISTVGEAGLVSPSAMTYDLNLPSPVLQLAINLAREIGSVKRGDKTFADVLVRILPEIMPAGKRMVALVEGKPLVKSRYGELREFYHGTEKLSEKDFYTTIGLGWYIGYLATFYDGIFSNFFVENLMDWLGGLKPQEFKRPTEASYYKVINLRDTKQLQDPNELKHMIAMFKHLDSEGKRFMLERMHRLVENSIIGNTKDVQKIIRNFEKDFEKKEKILLNYIEFYNFAKQYLTEETKVYLDRRLKLMIDIYKATKMMREKDYE